MRGGSRTQIDKLGDHIRKSSVVSDEDRAQLRQILAAHLEPMEVVQEQLQAILRVAVRARPKTEKSTIEKLRRNPRLSTIQDLAGVRIILSDSDPACAAVMARRAQRILGGRFHDRRKRPSHGYRALHLIVEQDGCWVEVQIRTRLQHRWAEIFEKLADVVGRQVRYGEPATEARYQPFVDAMLSASDTILTIEQFRRHLARQERRVIRLQWRIASLTDEGPVVQQLRKQVTNLLTSLASDRSGLETAEREYVRRLDAFDQFIEGLSAATGALT